MKEKIIFTIYALNAGGAERSLINLLCKLDSNKYDIDLLVFQSGGQLTEQLPAYVNVINIPYEISFLNNKDVKEMLRHFSLKCFIYRIIYRLFYRNKSVSSYNKDQILWKYVWKKCVPKLKSKYDIAVGYMHSVPSFYVIDKIEACNKILWVHHDYSKLKADVEFDFNYFYRANYVVTVSNICKEILCNNFPNLKEKFKVLSNINSADVIYKLSEQFIPDEYSDVTDINAAILLSIGRLHEVKGFDTAIDAASLLKNTGRRFRWFIIGEGELREKLQNKINQMKLEDNVILLGQKKNPYPYIKNAHIVIQTSKNEGKSIVLDESKILCKPIICTKYDSVSDQIENEENGLITEISAYAICKTVKRLLEDKELQDKLVNNLKNENHDTTDELNKYIRLFENESI